MSNHLAHPPHIDAPTTFMVSFSFYQISRSAEGMYQLSRVVDGKPNSKTDFKNRSLKPVFNYIAAAERCKIEHVRSAYEDAKKILENADKEEE